MHYQGDLDGQGPVWGYVEGGMGMCSFAIADAAAEAGAVLACGVQVAEISPGEGVTLEDGTCDPGPDRDLQRRPEADARHARRRRARPGDFRERLEAWKIRSPVVKFNASLERLPTWTAAPGESWPARATIDATGTMDEAQAAFERCAAGEPAVAFGEIYIQTGYDPSPAPEGKHLLSVFGQYAPYELADGDWDAAARRRRPAVHRADLALRARPPRVPGLDYEVLGPPDIESADRAHRRQHLPGRGDARSDVGGALRGPHPGRPGLYMCGAATHPAGSVIALNGRNAAGRRARRLRARVSRRGSDLVQDQPWPIDKDRPIRAIDDPHRPYADPPPLSGGAIGSHCRLDRG